MERSLKELLHIHKSGGNSSSYSSSSSKSTSLGEQDGMISSNEDITQTQEALAAMATATKPALNLATAKPTSKQQQQQQQQKQKLRSESSKSSSNQSKSSTSSEESDLSNESSIYRSFVTAISKPHKANNDSRWEAIQAAHSREGSRTLSLESFRLLKQLGSGDIGSVYLAELRGSDPCSYFAMKVMDKGSLASRKKLLRAQTEREILQCLDHPFLPSLYTHFETDKFSCVVMEFCSGGDLHMLRQRQHGKRFSEGAAKFYAAEVLLALEYLHMMGVIYRDLKPENVLVREDGHIMLSDFDLSLQCVVNPTLLKAPTTMATSRLKGASYCIQPSCLLENTSSCAIPSCIQPTCFLPRILPSFKLKPAKKRAPRADGIVVVGNQITPLPELVAEPTSARSLSFVGTHEYLAPEIIKGEGHGSAVDWWTFGIFLYELLYGRTPFKGAANRATLFNVIGQPLKFPDSPGTSFEAKDLIRGLLVKDPQHRLAYKKGATEIKQHAFFEGVNWALIRSMVPPQVPKPFQLDFPSKKAPPQSSSTSHLDFDFF